MAGDMVDPVLVDLRNVYTLEEMRSSPFAYFSVGRADLVQRDDLIAGSGQPL